MKIAFCVPGKDFTGWFLENWTELTQTLTSSPYIENLDSVIDWKLFRNYHPIINKTRTEVLRRAKTWNPDYYMWIDSDTNFKTSDFFKLLFSDKHIVSGLYHLQPPGGKFTNNYIPVTYACHKNSRELLYTTDNDLSTNQPIEVYANGMGWMLVRKEVFEEVENPFDQTYSEQSEDIIFQVKAREKGYKSYVIPDVILGHEKMLIVK
jgi:hypothetical protein